MPDTVSIRDAFNHYRNGRHGEATRLCRVILAHDPGHFNALNILGAIELEQENYAAAQPILERAVEAKPDNLQARTNLGVCLEALGEHARAVGCFQLALQTEPEYTPALTRLGDALSRAGDYPAAAKCYRKALEEEPNNVPLRNNHGTALAQQGLYELALAEFQRALSLRPDYVKALANQGSALSNLRRWREAAASYDSALAHDPVDGEVLAKGFMAKRHICDWGDYAQTARALLEGDRAEFVSPFALLSLTDNGARQLGCARAYAEQFGHAAQPAPTAAPRRSKKIRVAYLSPDFREHPLCYLMAGLFEQQDRAQFELVGVSLRAGDNSAMSRRVRGAFDHWLDVSAHSDEQAAARLRELGIDIAVDLCGYTRANRCGILARRPAPVQVNYLGYPGTMGAPFIDYIVADDYLIPKSASAHYSEAVVRLPNGFQAFDARAEVDSGSLTRGDASLPDRGWVFCAHNASYKINPALFDSWMHILREVPGSVLWVLARDEAVKHNLLREAELRNVAAERLVFAGYVDYARHLARLPLADLFLDTFPFNAGTTASDALRMGLPLLTCSGTSYASRMAGSLLTSLHLPELITTSLTEYTASAIKLASGDPLYPALLERLREQRVTAPIFNTGAFCRQFERALLAMWARSGSGQAPLSFSPREA